MIWRIWPCSHDWVAVESGDLIRGGHSLTAGAVIGRWRREKCIKCGCQRTQSEVV